MVNACGDHNTNFCRPPGIVTMLCCMWSGDLVCMTYPVSSRKSTYTLSWHFVGPEPIEHIQHLSTQGRKRRGHGRGWCWAQWGWCAERHLGRGWANGQSYWLLASLVSNLASVKSSCSPWGSSSCPSCHLWPRCGLAVGVEAGLRPNQSPQQILLA